MKKRLNFEIVDYVTAEKENSIITNNFNALEHTIGKLILKYFSPQKNSDVFENVVLSSAIIGMGSKIKILNNIDGFDFNKIEDIRKLNSIRNGTAHNILGSIIHTSTGKVTYNFKMLNSQGKLVTKNFKNEYDNFRELYSRVSIYIEEFTKNIG